MRLRVLFYDDAVGGLDHRPTDEDRASLEIDISPPESTYFAAASSGRCCHVKEAGKIGIDLIGDLQQPHHGRWIRRR